MNYYKHFFGNYDKHTKSLSILEHGVYRLLIDFYDKNESPLPPSVDEIADEIGARTKAEMAALNKILRKYFSLENDGYHNARCDEDIADYNERKSKNAENGSKGGRPKKRTESETEPTGLISESERFEMGSESVLKNNLLHSPLSTPHSPYSTNSDSERGGAENFVAEIPKWKLEDRDPTQAEIYDLVASLRKDEFDRNGNLMERLKDSDKSYLRGAFFSRTPKQLWADIKILEGLGWTATPGQLQRVASGEITADMHDRKSTGNSKRPAPTKRDADYHTSDKIPAL